MRGLLLILAISAAQPAQAARLKELVSFEGVRANHLTGYGLVVGLNGQGDNDSARFTVKSLAALMQRQGVNVSEREIRVKNVAAVMVTTKLPPFARPGQKLDVSVSSTGNAKSLQGGTLLLTRLKGADGRVYALVQGALTIGGFSLGAYVGPVVLSLLEYVLRVHHALALPPVRVKLWASDALPGDDDFARDYNARFGPHTAVFADASDNVLFLTRLFLVGAGGARTFSTPPRTPKAFSSQNSLGSAMPLMPR